MPNLSPVSPPRRTRGFPLPACSPTAPLCHPEEISSFPPSTAITRAIRQRSAGSHRHPHPQITLGLVLLCDGQSESIVEVVSREPGPTGGDARSVQDGLFVPARLPNWLGGHTNWGQTRSFRRSMRTNVCRCCRYPATGPERLRHASLMRAIQPPVGRQKCHTGRT